VEIERVNQNLLIDKLCERWRVDALAIELLRVVDARARRERATDLIARLDKIRLEKQEHLAELEAVLRRFGREPDEDTPSSTLVDRVGTALIDACRQPGASLDVMLEALLMEELIDVTGWQLLEELCKQATLDEDVLRAFRRAGRHEKQHLHVIRDELGRRQRAELELPAPPP
jgi:hypothetical protein